MTEGKQTLRNMRKALKRLLAYSEREREEGGGERENKIIEAEGEEL